MLMLSPLTRNRVFLNFLDATDWRRRLLALLGRLSGCHRIVNEPVITSSVARHLSSLQAGVAIESLTICFAPLSILLCLVSQQTTLDGLREYLVEKSLVHDQH